MSQCMTLQYRAQTPEGSSFNGTVEALDVQAAYEQLSSLGLTVLEIKPLDRSMFNWPTRGITGMDLQLFNEQLITLTKSGMPVEQGLKMIAHDLSSSRLKTAVTQVVSELDKGQSLPDAFESQKKHFPAMYARLMAIGTSTGRLPRVLMNLSEHLKMVAQLRASLSRAIAYPLTVFLLFMVLMLFILLNILPQFEKLFSDFGPDLPGLTILLIQLSKWASGMLPGQVIPGVVWMILPPLILFAIVGPWRRNSTDRMMRYVPMIGAVMRRHVVSRWCDGVAMGVNASMDLPQAMQLAADLIHLPSVTQDTMKLIACVQEGRPFSTLPKLNVIPATVLATIELAENGRSLHTSLADLSNMYRQQASLRLLSLESFLMPALLCIVGFFMGTTVIAMMLPLLKLITNLT